MKIFINTILFLILAFVVAISGAWINHEIIQTNKVSSIMENAEESFIQFKENFDPAKKTIVVIGRSTAIFSFQDNKESYDRYSFVDRLRENFNVLSLVNMNLLDFQQAHALLDFADSKIRDPDLVIIENPVYLTSEEFIDGSNDFILWMSCIGESSHGSVCQNFTPFKNQKEKMGFSINPCANKYREELRVSYLKGPNERQQVIKKVMDCGKSFNSVKEAEILISDSFSFGFAQDIKAVENLPAVPRTDLLNVKNRDKNFRKYNGPQAISYVDLLFINKYMKDILKDYHWKKFIFIPNHAREVYWIKNLPVFDANKDRVYFLDLTSELNSGKRTFAENFPDGTHPHFWIQNLIADKIYEISREKK